VLAAHSLDRKPMLPAGSIPELMMLGMGLLGQANRADGQVGPQLTFRVNALRALACRGADGLSGTGGRRRSPDEIPLIIDVRP
jgi:hypothetical protein